MALFPDAWIGELLSKNDIVSVVSEYVPLNKKGRRFWACCPFHHEKTPSFSVSPDRNIYYCFGCHAGGSVIQFVMEAEKLTYVEAVKHLARRVGMELPDEVNDDDLRRERALKNRLYDCCKDAALYFHETLKGERGAEARKYLLRRGLDARTTRRFGLGFAPDGWENLSGYLLEKGYTRDEIVAAGLASKSAKGFGCYDTFRNRVVFPIIATNGRVIGFGARTMGNDEPKYLNTGDTAIFNKRYNLYALNMMKRRQLADLTVVEGYMDVVGLARCGVDTCVATLGTAMTAQQARLMKRYVTRVFISYDGDAAGQNATLRSLDILEKEGLDVKVVVIPDNKDPDEYVKDKGAEGFLALKDSALAANAFRLEHMAGKYDLLTEDGREAYAREACGFVGRLQPIERDRYYALVARKTGFLPETLKEQGERPGKQEKNSNPAPRNNREVKEPGVVTERDRLEGLLLACICSGKPAFSSLISEAAPLIAEPAFAELLDQLGGAYASGGSADTAVLMSRLSPGSAETVAMALSAAGDAAEKDAAKLGADCIRTLRRLDAEDELKRVSESFSPAVGDEERARLNKRMSELMNTIRSLK